MHKPRIPSHYSGYRRPLKDHKNDRFQDRFAFAPKQHTFNQISLTSNAYNLQADKDLPIHEYSLSIHINEGFRDISDKAIRGNYVLRNIRKLIMQDVLPRMLSKDHLKGSVVIDSSLETIYTSVRFEGSADTGDPASEVFIFSDILVKNDLCRDLKVDIKIKYVCSFSSCSTDKVQNLMNSILHHQLLLDMLRFGSVYLHPDEMIRYGPTQQSRLDMISNHTMGLSISGIKHSSDKQNLVMINCPHSYVTSSHRLIDLLATYIFGQPIQDVKLFHSMNQSGRIETIPELASIRGNEDWFKGFCDLLSGYKCRGINQIEDMHLRFSITDLNSMSLSVEDEEEKTMITVQKQFRKVGINLNYPNLPCLQSKSCKFPYYPLEVCILLPDQKVPIFRLSTAARNHLSLLNKPKPESSMMFVVQARDKVAKMSADQMNCFGFKLSRVPVEAVGSSLPRPTLQFQDRKIEPNRDYWESGIFYQSMHLNSNWCVVDTVGADSQSLYQFFHQFSLNTTRFGFDLGVPHLMNKAKQEFLDNENAFDQLIEECLSIAPVRLIMFVIDSNSTALNRLIHLTFDEHPFLSAACLRLESIMNVRQHRSISRTLIHKLNARLGGTNVVYDSNSLTRLGINVDLMIIGLDVTHPDNELNGVSIVGCAYTYSKDLFKHRSLAWPQTARVEIIGRMYDLIQRLLNEYQNENNRQLPQHLIIYRDGVSHEEFERVKEMEILKVKQVLEEIASKVKQPKPKLSYIIAQKRHTMRFYSIIDKNRVSNPPSGTLIDKGIVTHDKREFYLYSNTSPQATARPLHYHVLWDELGIEQLQKLTYCLCFNFGRCSGSLSMPSSLRYAHNSAYEARNRVIAAREFSENKFYTSKFFC